MSAEPVTQHEEEEEQQQASDAPPPKRERMVKFIPVDHDPAKEFKVAKSVAMAASLLIRQMLEDDDDDDDAEGVTEVPLPEIKTDMLELVYEFMVHHAVDPGKKLEKPIPTNDFKELVTPWDVEFINKLVEWDDKEVLRGRIYEVMLRANYLGYTYLLDMCQARLACEIKDAHPDKIRKTFGISNDITPDEERQVREANPWIFQVSPVEPSPVPPQEASAAAAAEVAAQ